MQLCVAYLCSDQVASVTYDGRTYDR